MAEEDQAYIWEVVREAAANLRVHRTHAHTRVRNSAVMLLQVLANVLAVRDDAEGGEGRGGDAGGYRWDDKGRKDGGRDAHGRNRDCYGDSQGTENSPDPKRNIDISRYQQADHACQCPDISKSAAGSRCKRAVHIDQGACGRGFI